MYSLELELWVVFPGSFIILLLLLHRLPLSQWFIFSRYLAAPVVLFQVDAVIDLLESISNSTEFSFTESCITTVIWPNVLPFYLAPVLAYWFYLASARVRILVLTLSSVLYLVNIFWFAEARFNYRSYGTIKNDVSQPVPTNWKSILLNGDTLSADSFTNKLVLLDFWNSGCPNCIAAFGTLDSFYQLQKDNRDVRVQSVFIPYAERDSAGTAANIIQREGASFPVATGNGLDTVFGIKVYPTVLVIHQNKIIYRGNLKGGMQKVLDLKRL
ncbi:MAG: TlpA disulfide reductase family protein [Rubrivivax sp.]